MLVRVVWLDPVSGIFLRGYGPPSLSNLLDFAGRAGHHLFLFTLFHPTGNRWVRWFIKVEVGGPVLTMVRSVALHHSLGELGMSAKYWEFGSHPLMWDHAYLVVLSSLLLRLETSYESGN